MDDSLTRSGKQCWHRLDKVGLSGINDAGLLQNVIYTLLKEKFGQLDCYMDIIKCFNKAALVAQFGQAADMRMAEKNVSSFTMDDYQRLTRLKNLYGLFYAPLVSAMHYAR